MGAEQKKIVAQNKKAFHDYFVLDRFEAGIELCGTEIIYPAIFLPHSNRILPNMADMRPKLCYNNAQFPA